MIIAGVDPGKTGAMVILFEDGSTQVFRVPLLKPLNAKTRPDWRQWARLWRQALAFAEPDVFVMEKVEARPGQGVVSMFSFGKATGFVMAVIMYIDIPIHDAYPAVWKSKLGLIGYDKSKSIELARELVPSIIPELESKVKGNTADVRHGIAEAALLAYYGKMTIADTRP